VLHAVTAPICHGQVGSSDTASVTTVTRARFLVLRYCGPDDCHEIRVRVTTRKRALSFSHCSCYSHHFGQQLTLSYGTWFMGPRSAGMLVQVNLKDGVSV